MKLTKEEKNILLELIVNEQLKHLIPIDAYTTEKYSKLESLKTKIREM